MTFFKKIFSRIISNKPTYEIVLDSPSPPPPPVQPSITTPNSNSNVPTFPENPFKESLLLTSLKPDSPLNPPKPKNSAKKKSNRRRGKRKKKNKKQSMHTKPRKVQEISPLDSSPCSSNLSETDFPFIFTGSPESQQSSDTYSSRRARDIRSPLLADESTDGSEFFLDDPRKPIWDELRTQFLANRRVPKQFSCSLLMFIRDVLENPDDFLSKAKEAARPKTRNRASQTNSPSQVEQSSQTFWSHKTLKAPLFTPQALQPGGGNEDKKARIEAETPPPCDPPITPPLLPPHPPGFILDLPSCPSAKVLVRSCSPQLALQMDPAPSLPPPPTPSSQPPPRPPPPTSSRPRPQPQWVHYNPTNGKLIFSNFRPRSMIRARCALLALLPVDPYRRVPRCAFGHPCKTV